MGPANDRERLARIHVVVDGAGPLVDLVAHALRTCGLHRVRSVRMPWSSSVGRPPRLPAETIGARSSRPFRRSGPSWP